MPSRSVSPLVDASVPRPVITGTDIKVSQVAQEFEHHRMSPTAIVEAHPHLTLAQVEAAIAYYRDHRDAIEADWRETDDLVAALQARYPARSGRR